MHAILRRFIDPAEQGDLAPGPSDNVGQGHTEDGPGDAVSNRPGFALPIPGKEFGGGGLSKRQQLELADPGPLLTQEKAGLLSTWMMTEGLDCNPEGCCTI